MIRRRQFFGLTATGLGMLWSGSEAAACTLVAVNRAPFRDRMCRRALAEFVALLNDAPSLPVEDVLRRKDEIGVWIEEGWVDDRLGEERSNKDADRQYTFVREFRLSAGILDPRPIEIDGINLVRRLGNRATYQFTLKRYAYHPADPEGCNGLFVHDEYYGDDRLSCLATFSANHLKTVRRFPEWYLEA
ncbi:hypothetical protein LZK98_17260 [Sphingomonas cannabina]|uniref:hypothetical protein n=1 Tax=Sphingomonas cannabina TaxID=2899123 RepID=UPI001F3EEA85|nr:hypothetical protein [Sphingomonas cannabina]UIJ44784.1 hypothetical protein LZK98_17260 [Sphingomonas cannabina]